MVTGLMWASWHAPLFLMDSTSQAATSVVWFTVQGIALSVLLTWAYNATGGGLLLAVLAHAAVGAWYSAVLAWLAPGAADTYLPYSALTLVAAAALVVWRHGPRDLAMRPRQRWSARHRRARASGAIATTSVSD